MIEELLVIELRSEKGSIMKGLEIERDEREGRIMEYCVSYQKSSE